MLEPLPYGNLGRSSFSVYLLYSGSCQLNFCLTTTCFWCQPLRINPLPPLLPPLMLCPSYERLFFVMIQNDLYPKVISIKPYELGIQIISGRKLQQKSLTFAPVTLHFVMLFKGKWVYYKYWADKFVTCCNEVCNVTHLYKELQVTNEPQASMSHVKTGKSRKSSPKPMPTFFSKWNAASKHHKLWYW